MVNKHKRQDCPAPAEAVDSIRRCVDCDGEIPAGRLQAMPDAKRCVECQRDIENSGKWDWGMAD